MNTGNDTTREQRTKHKFRLACSIDSYLNNPFKDKRPPLPTWLVPASKKAKHERTVSERYWYKVYLATPPWITEEMIQEMKEIYNNRPEGYHVDHMVPLSSSLVCGLHVPWNLDYLPEKENLNKSNKYWQDHPFNQLDLFDD